MVRSRRLELRFQLRLISYNDLILTVFIGR